MYAIVVFIIPLMSLLYFLQTYFYKSLNKLFRILLLFLSAIIFLFDAIVAVYFYAGCYEMSSSWNSNTCLKWIYPTSDFKIMVLVSVILITITLWGMIQELRKRFFYLICASVLYLGVAFRMVVFIQSVKVMAYYNSSNPSIIFEFFTIIVVYGLVSAIMYLLIFLMGLLRKRVI